jgi:tetratricopeptide (TPR) repeat protein
MWLEGRLAAGLGRLDEAVAFFSRVRSEFKKRDMHYDLALVLLETAVALLEQGQHQEARKLAAEMAPIFRSKGVHREAMVALRLFGEAVEVEQATLDLARRVLDFLQRARYNRRIRFEDGRPNPGPESTGI